MYTSTVSGGSMCTPLFSDLLLPLSPKYTHLHSLVDPPALVNYWYNMYTSTHSVAFMSTLALRSDLLHSHSPNIGHALLLVDTGSLLRFSPNSCSLLLRTLPGPSFSLRCILVAPSLYLKLLYPPVLTCAHLHSLVHQPALFHRAPTSP
jgi:hypothetical protein